jgi:hypothetical protein
MRTDKTTARVISVKRLLFPETLLRPANHPINSLWGREIIKFDHLRETKDLPPNSHRTVSRHSGQWGVGGELAPNFRRRENCHSGRSDS